MLLWVAFSSIYDNSLLPSPCPLPVVAVHRVFPRGLHTSRLHSCVAESLFRGIPQTNEKVSLHQLPAATHTFSSSLAVTMEEVLSPMKAQSPKSEF